MKQMDHGRGERTLLLVNSLQLLCILSRDINDKQWKRVSGGFVTELRIP